MPTRFATAAQLLIALALPACTPHAPAPTSNAGESHENVVRVATFNLEDVRTEDVLRADHPRLKAAAAVIQEIRPDVIFLNEVAYDQPGAPGDGVGESLGQNGQRFADVYLAVSQGPNLEPLVYRAYMAPSNTGINSGYDLDNNNRAVTEFDNEKDRDAYGADCWGFGTFPGQYAMTLLVRDDIEGVADEVRTFQKFPWSKMPDAKAPHDPKTAKPWYTDEEWAALPLSSKSHWDVPLRFADGQILHLLCSHPTPPVFDGAEDRNGCRNHDEIRFWADYLSGEQYIVDDAGKAGGLADDASFVIVGDLNSDADEGGSADHPVAKFLLNHPRVQGKFVPHATSEGRKQYPKLDIDDTAEWGMRADYVLPSVNLKVIGGSIVRPRADAATKVSDHFPVWIDLQLPNAKPQ